MSWFFTKDSDEGRHKAKLLGGRVIVPSRRITWEMLTFHAQTAKARIVAELKRCRIGGDEAAAQFMAMAVTSPLEVLASNTFMADFAGSRMKAPEPAHDRHSLLDAAAESRAVARRLERVQEDEELTRRALGLAWMQREMSGWWWQYDMDAYIFVEGPELHLVAEFFPRAREGEMRPDFGSTLFVHTPFLEYGPPSRGPLPEPILTLMIAKKLEQGIRPEEIAAVLRQPGGWTVPAEDEFLMSLFLHCIAYPVSLHVYPSYGAQKLAVPSVTRTQVGMMCERPNSRADVHVE